jgi:N-methylhydantoinase B
LLECRYPLRIQQFCLRQDSGGAGRHRGGLGHIRDFEIQADGVKLLTSVERHGYKPWGIAGGFEGLSNDALLNPGTPKGRQVRKVTGFVLKKGDVLSMRSGGGGGFGPPEERDPQSVLDDVVDGLISIEKARSHYKCEIERIDASYVLDLAGTGMLRSQKKLKNTVD